MKTAVISICLLAGLAACGKTPDDPGRYRKPETPGSLSSRPLLKALPQEQHEEASVPRVAPSSPSREPVTRWM
jgi:hypothetical protein